MTGSKPRTVNLFAVLAAILVICTPIGGAAQSGTGARGYEPRCMANDAGCATWEVFRRAHPFPYQAIAVRRLPDGKVIVIVSEPPPNLEKRALDGLAKTAFGSAAQLQRKRWMIGVDGWLEDLVISVDAPLTDEFVRDGASILTTALFGTTFGSEIERIAERKAGDVKLDVPSYHVTPRELGSWMRDPALNWQDLRGTGPVGRWSEIAARKTVGAFASADSSLVMLTFPQALVGANADARSLERLRVPFREFAVASEGIVGGVWTKTGQVAVIARSRTTSQHTAAPLRFETFMSLLAAARETEELGQSYERNTPFAGKLPGGLFRFRDWAPIYLSPQLVNTEFGALLNITDQMLKSWSSAGHIEYLFFDYAKPQSYPFGKESLSEIVLRTTGEHSVLFNWNTAGSAVALEGSDISLITSVRSGSLPVTYGAGGKTAAQGGAAMYSYEDKAYDYFSSLRDPNLQRVVQYTVLYQLLRGATKDVGGNAARIAPIDEGGVRAVKSARAELVAATRDFLHAFAAKPDSFEPKAKSLVLAKFMREHGSNNPAATASLLADRNSDEAKRFITQQSTMFKVQTDALVARSNALDEAIKNYNARVSAAQQNVMLGRNPGVTVAQLTSMKASIENDKAKLRADVDKFNATPRSNPIVDAGNSLAALVQASQDLEPVRARYVKAFEHEPNGAIRTPSIVVSWDTADLLGSVGGHNLHSRAVRLEAAADVADMELKRASDGTAILRYNPRRTEAVESAAQKLARAVEHRGERDIAKLQALLSEAQPPRPRSVALMMDRPAAKETAPPVFARLGDRVYLGREAFVEDLRTMAGQNECCLFVIHDTNRNAFIAEAALKPPPVATVRQALDTPSLWAHLEANASGRAGGGKTAIFLDEPPSFAEALTRSMKQSTTEGPGTAAGGSGTRPPSGRGTYLASPDFDGNRSWMRLLDAPIQAASSKFTQVTRLGRNIPASTWRSAKVEVVERAELDGMLSSLSWDVARDGAPTGIKVSLESGTAAASDLAVIAGVENVRPSTGVALKSAGETAKDAAAIHDASAAQYLMTIKSRLGKLDDQQLRRLVLVSRSPAATMYFSKMEVPGLVASINASSF